MSESLNSFQEYVLRIVRKYPGIKRDHNRLQGTAQDQIDPLIEAGYLSQTKSGKLKLVDESDGNAFTD